MAPELGHIGPIVVRTYSLFLNLAIITGLGLLTWFGWQLEDAPTRWVDAGLSALAGGIVFGRLGHAAIHWAYYSAHLNEVPQFWRGGLDWHGAVLGGIGALAIYCRVRSMRWRLVSDVFSLIVPAGTLFIYTGCLMVSCGHGLEVRSLADYPPLIAAEMPNLYGVVAPRLLSQGYGIVLSVILIVFSLLLSTVVTRRGIRLWIVLALLGLGVFGIGFTRGDAVPMVGILRLDQILDLLTLIIGLLGAGLAWQGGIVITEDTEQKTRRIRVLGAYDAD